MRLYEANSLISLPNYQNAKFYSSEIKLIYNAIKVLVLIYSSLHGIVVVIVELTNLYQNLEKY